MPIILLVAQSIGNQKPFYASPNTGLGGIALLFGYKVTIFFEFASKFVSEFAIFELYSEKRAIHRFPVDGRFELILSLKNIFLQVFECISSKFSIFAENYMYSL